MLAPPREPVRGCGCMGHESGPYRAALKRTGPDSRVEADSMRCAVLVDCEGVLVRRVEDLAVGVLDAVGAGVLEWVTLGTTAPRRRDGSRPG